MTRVRRDVGGFPNNEGDVSSSAHRAREAELPWRVRIRGDWSRKGPSSMEFQDKMLKCVDCGAEFVFTAGEQLFFRDKQFTNAPKRCKACKSKRAGTLGGAPPPSPPKVIRTETRAVCSHCGKETTVPFRPTQGRPVFCRECFQGRRGEAVGA